MMSFELSWKYAQDFYQELEGNNKKEFLLFFKFLKIIFNWRND